MAVEPPLVEVHVHEGRDGAVVVRKRLLGDIKAIHAGMPDRYEDVSFPYSREEGRAAHICDHAPSGQRERRGRVKEE